MATTNTTDLFNQQVSFIQHFLTGMDAGAYQLKLRQTILDGKQQPVSGKNYDSSYTFAVKANRFALANPGQVLSSVFPPENADGGQFSNVLPHVVFAQKTFPWVRYPTLQQPYPTPAPGVDTDADVPTWLWVMLLDDDDVAECLKDRLSLDLKPATRTVADLFPPSALPAGVKSTLGNNYSYFDGAKGIGGLEPGEDLGDAIQTIDVPLRLFWKIAPSLADLRQMAHGRVVSLINQNTTTNTPDPGTPTGSFSVVFGNRLPADKHQSTALLVSLEQLQRFLTQDTLLDGNLSLRLAVLKSWQFYSVGQSATFVHQVLGLNGRTADAAAPARNTNLRLIYQGSHPAAQGAFNMGYVPLNEILRTAGKTVSWYRGPLTPYRVEHQGLKLPIPSPDAALVFDPTTGMLDTSYAAAWSIGRMIALQDKNFSTGYYNWKRDLEHQVVKSVEDRLLEASFGAALSLGAPAKQARAAPGGAAPHGSRSLLKRTILSLNPAD